MKNYIAIGIIVLSSLAAAAQECKQTTLAAGEYAGRRSRIIQLMDTSSALVMKGASEELSDVVKFRQDEDFNYLTGIQQPGARMILFPIGIPSGQNLKTCFFFANFRNGTDPGILLSPSDSLLDEFAFDEILPVVTRNIKTVYYEPGMPFIFDWINSKPYFAEKEMKKAFEKAHPGVKLKSAGSLIAQLRMVKSGEELDAMRKAISLTGDGIASALRSCKPGMYEYEIQACIEYEATRQGSTGMGFPSIIGGGKNSLIPHYFDNNCLLNKGDLLVMDVGADFKGYSADITRTIPVSGKFTQGQAEVYAVVLNVQKALINMVKPGTTFSDLDRKANELIKEAGYGRYILHGVTHTVGLNVHDDMPGDDTLKAGMVITIEPGIYIPADDTVQPAGRKGFGIRIEDDILVNKNGPENLSAAIPREITDIEKLMK